jgi:hypothetical protein
MTGNRLVRDLDVPTASMMAIGSEVFGSCVEGIDVSAESKKRDDWFLLCAEIFEVYWSAKSGSRMAE